LVRLLNQNAPLGIKRKCRLEAGISREKSIKTLKLKFCFGREKMQILRCSTPATAEEAVAVTPSALSITLTRFSNECEVFPQKTGDSAAHCAGGRGAKFIDK